MNGILLNSSRHFIVNITDMHLFPRHEEHTVLAQNKANTTGERWHKEDRSGGCLHSALKAPSLACSGKETS